MKKAIYIIGIFLSILSSTKAFSQVDSVENTNITSTFYFIRHAEKDRSNPNEPNPHLINSGKERAQNWAHFFKDIPLTAIYSTSYHRTVETASPTALQKNLEIQLYDARKLDPSPFLNNHKGSHVLIVGHSNTTPAFVNNFLGETKYADLLDSNNGSVFVVQFVGDLKLVNEYHID